MPNATPLTDAINALTTYANETTGASDTNLSDAVRTLVDGYGGGSASYSGTFTVTERRATYDFYAPNCTYIAIIATTPPSISTGLAFVYGCVAYVDRLYAAQSNNSGNGIAGANDTGKVSYTDDTFTIKFGNANNSKTPQVGITYAWCAW